MVTHGRIADLFGGFDTQSNLLDRETRVDVQEGVTPVHVARDDDDVCEAVEAFAGWNTLDRDAAEIRARVLALVEPWLRDEAATCFGQSRFPKELFAQLGTAGAIGASLVGREGKPPLSRLATCAIMHALEYGDGGLRCAVTIQDSVIQALVRFGDNAQRERWLQPLVHGQAVASFALTEPQAGSDVRALSTKATRVDGDWVIRGSKGWITNAPHADVLLVWARTSERNDAIRGFLIERGTPGLDIEPIGDAVAMRVAPVGRVTLDDVHVPNSALLPHAWGLSDINACLDYNRLTVLFGVMGAARFCLEWATKYSRTRHQFGVPIGSKQLVQERLADMACQVGIGELLSLQLASRWEAGPLPRFDVSLAKRNNCSVALDVARSARAVLGANGVDLKTHVARHMLNLEASYSYGGTHEIHGLVIGKILTGENAF
jgi:glutaryl-CoA dehydrogenase